MKTPIIGNYTNKYPQNNNRQTSASSPNFGMHLVRDRGVRANIANVLGSKNLTRVVRFLTELGQDKSLIARFNTAVHFDDGLKQVVGEFDPESIVNWKHLRAKPIYSEKDGHVIVRFVDGSGCEGTGVSVEPDKAAAAIEASNIGFRNYAISKIDHDVISG